MNESNGNNRPVELQHGAESKQSPAPDGSNNGSQQEIVTRTAQTKKPDPGQKQVVLITAVGIIVALLAFALTSIPHKNRAVQSALQSKTGQTIKHDAPAPAAGKSSVPVTESIPNQGGGDREGLLREQDVQRTAGPSQPKNPERAGATGPAPGQTLGAIAPFEGDGWQAPPYSSSAAETSESLKAERELLEKPSLVFVRSTSPGNSSRAESASRTVGIGLPTGTRLRARLETTATSAVRLPVIAVIEYNYSRNGEILIPAGTKAFGRVDQADRTGYMSIHFDSLMMPDGAEVPFEAVATDLRLAPLRGKVQGKNTGKSVLARSLSGVGQAGALIAGRGSLNQPFSEQDLIRERVATNIGDESDREVARLTVSEHIVVSVPAGTAIYVVLQKAAKQATPEASSFAAGGASLPNQELLQLLQKGLAAQNAPPGRSEQ